MSKSIFPNLGFVLQIAGMFMLLPIGVGLYLSEIQPLVSYFITAIAFFVCGFVLNVLSKREMMDLKSSSILASLTFLALGLIGTIPYMYMGVFSGSFADSFSSSLFESMSGYTTAGFSLLYDIDHEVPQSMVFYRAVTQWVGGIGIVFILLAFFYPGGEALRGLCLAIGLDKMVAGIKLVLSRVLILYTIYAAIFIAMIYILGFTNLIDTASLVMSALVTGGFSPVTDFSAYSSLPMTVVLIAIMLIGSMNFFMHDKLLLGRVRGTFKTEFVVFAVIILAGIGLLYYSSGMNLKDSIFHAISASSTSGFQTVGIGALPDSSKLVLMFLMAVGGMTFSTSGGMKVLRFVMFLKVIPWMMQKLVHDPKKPLVYEGEEIDQNDVNFFLIFPALVLGLLFISVFVFVFHGFSIADGLFESISAYSLTGFTTGDVTEEMPATLKLWMTLMLIVGRVEIVLFLIAFVSRGKHHFPSDKNKSFAS